MSLGSPGGGGGYEGSALQARHLEEIRQNDVKAGRARVDEAFSGFNDGYFDKYKSDYLNAYRPQVDQQYADTRKNVALALSRSGNLSSSYGASELAKLDAKRLERNNQLDDSAIQAVNERRNAVEGSRSDLYSLAAMSADPGGAAQAAAASRAALDTPVAASPLGDLFSSFTNMASTAAMAEANGYYGTGGMGGMFGGSRRRDYIVN